MEDLILNLFSKILYYLTVNLKGYNMLQLFFLVSVFWMSIIFILTTKYNKMFERLINVAIKQDEILEKVEHEIKISEIKNFYSKKLEELFEENKQLKISNLIQTEFVNFLKNK